MEIYIGLDVHSKQTVYACQNQKGKVLKQGSIPTTPEGFAQMLGELCAPEKTKIGLESGTQSAWVSRLLVGMGMQPVVIDAREVRAKARRIGQKCDSRDAFEICDGLRRGIYSSIVYVPEIEVQQLRIIISRRRHFVGKCTGQVNAVKFLLRSIGLSNEASTLTTYHAWNELLDRPGVAQLREFLAMHAKLWLAVHEIVEALDEMLDQALEPFRETVDLLTSVPGVGPVVSATFIAVVGTPQRFADSAHLASYVGLVPSTYDSGDRQRHGRITKRGASDLRAMLCEAAHHAANPKHPLNPYFRLICARGGYKKAVVAVAHRLARIMYQMWRKAESFDVTQLNVTRCVRTAKRVHYYDLKEKQAARA